MATPGSGSCGGNGSGAARRWRARAIDADEAHEEVFVAWQGAQQLRAAYLQRDLADGRRRAETILASFHTCPIPEVARLGRNLRRWRQSFLAYFTTGRANNGGTEAMNGIIELARRYRNRENYRLRMLLAGGGLRPWTPPDRRRP